jgi:hypothetical protein
MVIRWRYAGDTEKGEEVFPVRANEILSQGFGRLETKGLFTAVGKLLEEVSFHAGG